MRRTATVPARPGSVGSPCAQTPRGTATPPSATPAGVAPPAAGAGGLGIADAVASKPLQVADLAARVGADEDALARLLRMLASKGYFRRDRSGRWRNTAASELLRSDHPDSARSWVRFVGSQWHGEIWNRAEHSFRTGESATVAALGAPF